MSFMSKLGHLEVRAEEDGLKLAHAASNWVDYLSWDQVKHLLLPAVREVAPHALAELDGVKAPTTDVPEDPEDQEEQGGSFTTLPSDVLDELRSAFSAWFTAELDGIRAEVGKELKDVHDRISAIQLGGDSKAAAAVTTEAAVPPAAAKATAARTPRKTASASK